MFTITFWSVYRW